MAPPLPVTSSPVPPPLPVTTTPPLPAVSPMSLEAEHDDTMPTASLDSAEVGLFGSNSWGGRGPWHLDAAQAARPGALQLAFSTQLAAAAGRPFGSPQEDGQSSELSINYRLHAVYTPLPQLELGLSYGFNTNRYVIFYHHSIQSFGSPILNIKYAAQVSPRLGLGAVGTLLVPSSLQGGTPVPRAAVLTARGLATYRLGQRAELTANLGYIYDRSAALADAAALQPDSRYSFGVNGFNSVALGLGAMAQFKPSQGLGLSPFVELGGAIGIHQRFKDAPLRGTLGLKGTLLPNHLLELTLGVDLRITGAPRAGAPFPGLLPMTGFILGSLHFFDHPKETVVYQGTRPCAADADCGKGQRCREKICVLTIEVVREIRQGTFTVTGQVLDDVTGRGVPEATVTLAGFAETPLIVDYRTGNFHSFPVPSGSGLLRLEVRAPNYQPNVQMLKRGAPNSQLKLDFRMLLADRPAMGKLQVIFKNAHTSQSIAGAMAFIPSLQQKILANAEGSFVTDVKAGHFDVLLSAPGYHTQRRKLTLHDGEVVILNIYLAEGN